MSSLKMINKQFTNLGVFAAGQQWLYSNQTSNEPSNISRTN